MEWFDASSEEYSDYDSWRLLNVPLILLRNFNSVIYHLSRGAVLGRAVTQHLCLYSA
jgi:hypothetical protein